MLNCKLCGVPLPIAEDGEILPCVVCELTNLKKRMLSLELQYQTLQEFAVSAPISIPGVLEQFSQTLGDTEEFRKKCNENYDHWITNIMNQLKHLEEEITKIKLYCKWLKNK